MSQGPLALVNRIIAIHRARLKTLMFISRQNVVGDNENITSWTLSFILSPPRYLLLFTSYLISIHKETLHEFRSAIRGGHNLLLTIIKKTALSVMWGDIQHLLRQGIESVTFGQVSESAYIPGVKLSEKKWLQ